MNAGALRADGVVFSDHGLIASSHLSLAGGGVVDGEALSLADVTNPEVLRLHARRRQQGRSAGPTRLDELGRRPG